VGEESLCLGKMTAALAALVSRGIFVGDRLRPLRKKVWNSSFSSVACFSRSSS
jgi:hypothetical protein